jgi:beta-phosphoglucomutase-like phosphatase (HAD superfamily)
MHGPSFLFDLDGTLVDSVYHHVLAWQEALARDGIHLSVWRIHRRIGMCGGLLANAMLREIGRPVTPEDAARLRRYHAEAYGERVATVRALPGASELLSRLTELGVPWSIATSGYRESAGPLIELLDVPDGVPIVTFKIGSTALIVPGAKVFIVTENTGDLYEPRRFLIGRNGFQPPM